MDRVASRGASRLISNFLVDSRLCHSISIAISKKFLGMESHTFSSKEQNGMKFHKKNNKICIFCFTSKFRSAGKCFMAKHVTLLTMPITSEIHSLRYGKYLRHGQTCDSVNTIPYHTSFILSVFLAAKEAAQ